ncbi:MAG: molybdopterin-dependent oxidoreductase [Pirellulales bacterium]|nr:molybdopterin-dependent oxidoreductase [Pirellulales bacterium]
MLPPGQQLVACDKWPLVGERAPNGALDPWIIHVAGLVSNPQILALGGLRKFGWVEQVVDIHCVTRWSKPGVRFGGVTLQSILDRALPQPSARYISLVAHSHRHHSTSLPLADALELDTMLALEVNGEPLPVEHGGPVRVVVPGRYFYKSLKWLAAIELLADDRLGYWESVAGYHNRADPWREQRYVATGLTKQQAQVMLAARDIRSQELRNLAAAQFDLSGLTASRAILRNANFRRAKLSKANFDGANLSNAHFEDADLSSASFVGADVEGADFRGSNLRGANFSGASLVGVSFCEPFESTAGHDAIFQHGAKLDSTTLLPLGAAEMLTPDQSTYLKLVLRN